jgi:protein-L-isoaspartate(D-aspartate) O-methyltransferase
VLLAHLVAQVFSIERIRRCFRQARDADSESGRRNVSLLLGDGTVGWRGIRAYDAILVGGGAPSRAAAARRYSSPDGGTMLVAVVRFAKSAGLVLAIENGTGSGIAIEKNVAPVRFVRLGVGDRGWLSETRPPPAA